MATQRIDGTWTPIEPLLNATKTFIEEAELGKARLLFVGTEREIQEEMSKRSIEERIEALEKAQPARSRILEIPTQEDLRNFCRELPDGA